MLLYIYIYIYHLLAKGMITSSHGKYNKEAPEGQKHAQNIEWN